MIFITLNRVKRTRRNPTHQHSFGWRTTHGITNRTLSLVIEKLQFTDRIHSLENCVAADTSVDCSVLGRLVVVANHFDWCRSDWCARAKIRPTTEIANKSNMVTSLQRDQNNADEFLFFRFRSTFNWLPRYYGACARVSCSMRTELLLPNNERYLNTFKQQKFDGKHDRKPAKGIIEFVGCVKYLPRQTSSQKCVGATFETYERT